LSRTQTDCVRDPREKGPVANANGQPPRIKAAARAER
jgi:hypothetical protein